MVCMRVCVHVCALVCVSACVCVYVCVAYPFVWSPLPDYSLHKFALAESLLADVLAVVEDVAQHRKDSRKFVSPATVAQLPLTTVPYCVTSRPHD